MANKKRKWLRWIVLLVLVAVVGGYFMLRSKSGAQYAEATATSGNISTTYSFTGNIAAPHRQTLTASGIATVKTVYESANDTVESGDRLMKLSDGTLVKSDIDGEVVRLGVQEGDVVAAGSELATVMDVNQLEVEISIDEYDVSAVAIGKRVEVAVNAIGVTCSGIIESFDKDANTDGTLAAYTAVVAIEAPEGVLPGMQVEVRMLNQSAENATLLTVEALQFDDANRAYVLTRANGADYVETYVETGINDGTNVQIVSGIQSGTTVYYARRSDDALVMMSPGGGFRQ